MHSVLAKTRTYAEPAVVRPACRPARTSCPGAGCRWHSLAVQRHGGGMPVRSPRRVPLVEDDDHRRRPRPAAFLGLQLEGADATLEATRCFPAGKPAKSDGLRNRWSRCCRARTGGRRHVTAGCDVARVGLVDHAEVDVLDVRDRAGRRLFQHRLTEDSEGGVLLLSLRGLPPAALELRHEVWDPLVVAHQAGEAVPSVGIGDRLNGPPDVRAPGRA